MPKKGKKGVEQRVKGNVKTASSSRANELLGKEAGGGGGFIGFGAVSAGLVGTSNGNRTEGLPNSGAEFQVVMKQLGKKDPTTKLKALQEFSVLCQREQSEVVVGVLDIWTLMYNKLSMDNDNRVREASHKALRSCQDKVKGAMGVHLKSFLGCWISGMCDPYGPASTAAQVAFGAAFSLDKQKDVLQFGFEAIFRYAEQIILKESPDSFSDTKTTSEDERVQRYERALVMAIKSLSLTLRKLDSEFLSKKKGNWERVLGEKRTWKLNKHTNPYIRAAIFTLISAVCEQLPDYIHSKAKLFCGLVLSMLGESDPVVIGPLWESALMVITKTESWDKHVNVQKALLPGLWSLLAAGGYGSAKVTYPCLLPLLSRLMETVYSDDAKFPVTFLERVWHGLEADRVRTSRSECEVVMETFSVCFMYIIENVKLNAYNQNEFYKDTIRMLMEIVNYGLEKCPAAQTEVIFSSIAKLVGNLILYQEKSTIFKPHMSNLQLQIGTVCTAALRKADTDQDSARMRVNFTRVGVLMKCFQSPPEHFLRKPSKSISFESNPRPHLNPYHLFPANTTGATPKPLTADYSSKQFLKPTVCTICANSIAAIVGAPDTNYSQLLLTLLRSYADRILVKSVFSSLDANYYYLMQTHKDRKTLQQKLLILCMLLAKAARLEDLSVESSGFTEDVIACIVALITSGEVDDQSASMFFEELCKQNQAILPLVLVLLSENCKMGIYHSVLAGCSPVLNSILNHITDDNSIFLARFLHNFFSVFPDVSLPLSGMPYPASAPEVLAVPPPIISTERRGSAEHMSQKILPKTAKVRRHTMTSKNHPLGPGSITCGIIHATFSTICNLLNDSFSLSVTEKSLTLSSFKILLEAVNRAVQDTDITVHHVEDVTKLLGSILHWCLNEIELTERDMSLLEPAVQCYHSLMTSLPDIARYIHSLPGLVMEDTTQSLIGSRATLPHSLQSSLLFFSLHYKAMETSNIIWNLYEPFLTSISDTDESYFPQSALEAFCDGSTMLYSPYFNQQTSKSITITSSFPMHFTPILYPTAMFCDPKLLAGIFAARKSEGREAERFENFIDAIISNVLANSEEFDFLDRVCGVHGALQDFNAVHCGRGLNELVMYLCVALVMLQPCELKNLDQHELVTREVIQSALERSLEAMIKHHSQWIEAIIEQLIERISSDGPLWLLVMNQLFTSLGKLHQDKQKMTSLTSLLFKEPVSAVLHSALSPLDETVYSEQLKRVLANVENDPNLLICCVRLLPQNVDLVQSATKALSLTASKQSQSEINIFENVLETCQDPFAFSVLGLMEELVKRLKVPSDSWDYVLCSLVTLTQMLAEANDDTENLSHINLTVFACHVYKLCCEVFALFNQPHIEAQQSKEWEEFFLPAIQECLATHFMKTATHSHALRTGSSCMTYHNYYLCQAVSVLCTSPENIALEDLVDSVVQGAYHQQVTAYILATRLLHSIHIYKEDTDVPSDSKKSPLRLLALQDMFGKALEKVNMDVVFLEDSLNQSTSANDSACSSNNSCDSHHHNTTSYIFIWLLIIDAMSQCDAETRSALGEWMKDLSQFDHLLQGLFKFLSETTKRTTTLEVTLTPSLSRLAFVTYYSVAKHLPSMLRQWFLTVDRQTNALVNQLTTKCISPILQQEELQSFSKRTTNIGNMEVRVHSGVSEVSVTYRVDEFSTELFVSLPTSYPLTSPSIREGKRARIDPALWRKWLLQFNIFISNQNGSLMDGILLWKKNLDKHFAGVEDCMICFSVIHSSNYSLPKMLCRTCKKKFHSACLYKWFNTSAKSSCPLCRNIF